MKQEIPEKERETLAIGSEVEHCNCVIQMILHRKMKNSFSIKEMTFRHSSECKNRK